MARHLWRDELGAHLRGHVRDLLVLLVLHPRRDKLHEPWSEAVASASRGEVGPTGGTRAASSERRLRRAASPGRRQNPRLVGPAGTRTSGGPARGSRRRRGGPAAPSRGGGPGRLSHPTRQRAPLCRLQRLARGRSGGQAWWAEIARRECDARATIMAIIGSGPAAAFTASSWVAMAGSVKSLLTSMRASAGARAVHGRI